MTDVRAAALAIEAVKVSMSQTKDGMKITFVIHPDDGDASELFSHHVGSRYQMALVLLGDDGEPIVPKSRTDAERAVIAAGMLPREPAFLQWLYDKGRILDPNEGDAINYIHHQCGITSRSELKSNKKAREIFDQIRLDFSKDRGFP